MMMMMISLLGVMKFGFGLPVGMCAMYDARTFFTCPVIIHKLSHELFRVNVFFLFSIFLF